METGFSVKPRAPASRSYSSGLDQPLAAGLLDQRGDLLAGVGRRHLVHQPDAEQPQDRRGDRVDHHDHRAEHGDDAPDRRAEHQRGAVGAGERDVLRDHLAEHDVQVDDDRQADHERDRVQQRLRHVGRLEHRLEQVGHRRLADGTEDQRADGDAELVDPDDQRHVLHRRAASCAAIREPASALGSIWVRRAETRANSAPTKKALPSSSSSATTSAVPPLTAAPPRVAVGSPGSSSRSVSRSMRSPSMCSTVSVTMCSRGPSSSCVESGTVTSARSPVDGHPAEHLEDQAGDGVVVLALGQRDAGEVLDLVGAQQPGDQPGAVAPALGLVAEAVVLVGDVADDLLDDVLERDDAGVPAVLVEDDGELEAVRAQQRQQRVEPQRVGHHDRPDHQVLDLGRGPLVDRQGDGVLDVHGADHGVLGVEHREARVPGLAGQLDDLEGAVVLLQGQGAHPRAS